MNDLTDMRCRQTDLIPIGGIAMRGFFGNDFLRQLAGNRFIQFFQDVAAAADTHGLIDVAASA